MCPTYSPVFFRWSQAPCALEVLSPRGNNNWVEEQRHCGCVSPSNKQLKCSEHSSNKQWPLLPSWIPGNCALATGNSTKAVPSQATVHCSKNARVWPYEHFTTLRFMILIGSSTSLGVVSRPPSPRRMFNTFQLPPLVHQALLWWNPFSSLLTVPYLGGWMPNHFSIGKDTQYITIKQSSYLL